MRNYIAVFDREKNIRYITDFNTRTGEFKCESGKRAILLSHTEAVKMFDKIEPKVDSDCIAVMIIKRPYEWSPLCNK